MDDRRILMGLVYPVRFGGFCHIKNKSQGGILHETENRKKAAGRFAHAGDGDRAMPSMSLTAYADNTETLLTTITATGKEQASVAFWKYV